MKRFLKELGETQQEYVIQCDNQSAKHLSKKFKFSFEVKAYRYLISLNTGSLMNKLQQEKVRTDENGSDMKTNSFSKEKQGTCWRLVGMYMTS